MFLFDRELILNENLCRIGPYFGSKAEKGTKIIYLYENVN